MKRWGLFALIVALVALTACSSGSQPVCGADLCVTDVRALRNTDGTITLLFELTALDGSIDEANPPTFAAGLNVTLLTQGEDEERYMDDRAFAADEFICTAGTNVPGAEGRRAAACLLILGPDDLSAMPEPGSELTISFYNETYPIDLRPIRVP